MIIARGFAFSLSRRETAKWRGLTALARIGTMSRLRMRNRTAMAFRRAGAAPAPALDAVRPRWFDGGWMPLLSAIVLTLAFAPIGQFYLAWIGLVPWLLYIRRARSHRLAFLWSWIAGTFFFSANIWWLGFVTVLGTIGSVLYMGLYWGIAALILRGLRWTDNGGQPLRGGTATTVLIVACVWTACEWVRGNLFTGWPWSFLGHTQTPLLVICQIADLIGAYGLTFLLVAFNAFIALLIVQRLRFRAVMGAAITVAAIVLASIGYGIFRLSQNTTSPGPRVLVVQANFPQSNTGDKGAPESELVRFHIDETTRALEAEAAAGRRVDLVAWSETMLPAINQQARDVTNGYDYGAFLNEVLQAAAGVAFTHDVAILAGGNYFEAIDDKTGLPMHRRNVAYYFNKTGLISDLRYDKIHLVPFGEYIPLRYMIPPLYRLFIHLGPHDFDYTVTPGKPDALTVFPVPKAGEMPRDARFVTPICFEDADPRLVARMFRGEDGKRADFIVNITNDGWFSQPQLSQHLQIARFRSIENRVPTARSVNTGISAFIDSNGRVYQRLPAQVAGSSVAQLHLDGRVTLYTRFGDFFAGGCTIATALLLVWSLGRARLKRRLDPAPSPAAAGDEEAAKGHP
jgi:apolipoprotein N-acyltransferase